MHGMSFVAGQNLSDHCTRRVSTWEPVKTRIGWDIPQTSTDTNRINTHIVGETCIGYFNAYGLWNMFLLHMNMGRHTDQLRSWLDGYLKSRMIFWPWRSILTISWQNIPELQVWRRPMPLQPFSTWALGWQARWKWTQRLQEILDEFVGFLHIFDTVFTIFYYHKTSPFFWYFSSKPSD